MDTNAQKNVGSKLLLTDWIQTSLLPGPAAIRHLQLEVNQGVFNTEVMMAHELTPYYQPRKSKRMKERINFKYYEWIEEYNGDTAARPNIWNCDNSCCNMSTHDPIFACLSRLPKAATKCF